MKNIIGTAFLCAAFLSANAWAQPSLPPPRFAPTPKPAPVPGSTVEPEQGDTAAPLKPPPDVSISAAADAAEVPRGETLRFTITLEWEEPADEPRAPLDFEFPEPPKAEGMALFANTFKSETVLTGGSVKIKRIYNYDFRAESEGETQIGEVKIDCSRIGSEEKNRIKTQPIPVKVVKPAFNPAKIIRHPAGIAAIVVLVVTAAAGLVVPRLREKRDERQEAESAPAPWEEARSRLRDIDRLRMAGDYAEYMAAICGEADFYLERALGIRARSGSHEKAAKAAAELLGEEWGDRLKSFYRVCDQVKFAGRAPDAGEMDAAGQTLRDLIDREEELAGASSPKA